jgi:mono/diheme cytochrome c family protein
MMKRLLCGGVGVALVAACGISFVYSGIYNVAASSPDSPAVAWLLHTTYQHSMQARSRDIAIPTGLETARTVQAGGLFFKENCAICHGAPGETRTSISMGLVPQPPYLLSADRLNKPAQMFWVIKNGVKMTGMPAFGKTESDQVIWQVAAFLHAERGVAVQGFEILAGQSSRSPIGNPEGNGPNTP